MRRHFSHRYDFADDTHTFIAPYHNLELRVGFDGIQARLNILHSLQHQPLLHDIRQPRHVAVEEEGQVEDGAVHVLERWPYHCLTQGGVLLDLHPRPQPHAAASIRPCLAHCDVPCHAKKVEG